MEGGIRRLFSMPEPWATTICCTDCNGFGFCCYAYWCGGREALSQALEEEPEYSKAEQDCPAESLTTRLKDPP